MFKYVLLALIAKEPRHGYELKRSFERLFGGTWPVNVGQVYTTLGRLEREGLVRAESRGKAHGPERFRYSLTPAGHRALAVWLEEPAVEPVPLKEGIFAKVAAHSLTVGGSPDDLLRRQREVYLQLIRELTELQGADHADPLTVVLLEGAILHVEADLRWLEVCERHLMQ